MAQLLPTIRQRFFSDDGEPLVGGKLYAYVAGTSTPKATYQDEEGDVPNTHPIILDANGECDVWIDGGLYKFILEDADGVQQWTRDNISRPADGAQGASFLTGDEEPDDSLGENGDSYLDIVTLLFYQKTAGSWVETGAIEALSGITGDVVATGPGSAAATIQPDVVSNTKLANMATQTFKGRTTAGTGDPEDLTATQATAILNAMVGDSGSGGTKGLVPAPASGDAAADKFLKADGTWTEVISGGGGGGSLEWFESGAAPLEEIEYFKKVRKYYQSALGTEQNLFVNIHVPSTYSQGDPISLRIKFYSPDTSGTVALATNTVISNPDDPASDLSTNVWASTNGAFNLATLGVANAIHELLLDLTDPSGESFAGNPVEPGAILTVALTRHTDTATSDVRFIQGSAEVVYGS